MVVTYLRWLIIVFLAAVMPLNLVLAGNGGNGGEKTPEEERVASPRKPDTTLQTEDPVAVSTTTGVERAFSDYQEVIDDNLLKHIFTFVEAQDLLTLRLVCKCWKHLSDELLIKFSIVKEHKKLASDCVFLPPSPKLPKPQKEKLAASSSQRDAFLVRIRQEPISCFLLCNHYLTLNPLDDFREIDFVAWVIIPRVQKLRTLLAHKLDFLSHKLEVLKSTRKTDIFPMVAQDSNRRRFLQRYLMAAKLLSVCGDQKALEELKHFRNHFGSYLKGMIKQNDLSTSPIIPCPFLWASYSGSQKIFSNILVFLNSLIENKMETGETIENLNKFIKCTEYCELLDISEKAKRIVPFLSEPAEISNNSSDNSGKKLVRQKKRKDKGKSRGKDNNNGKDKDKKR